MANVFAGSEIVEMGIQIEKNGRDFYSALAGQSKSEKAKGIFKHLAGEEESHIATFQKILRSVEKYEPQEAYTDEYFSYMNALAGEYVFTKKDKGAEIAKNIKDDKEAVKLGIGMEQDSILFYEAMKKSVPEKDRAIIDQLICQEQGHLVKLINLKKEL